MKHPTCSWCERSAKRHVVLCMTCSAGAEDMLHPRAKWTPFEKATHISQDPVRLQFLRGEGFDEIWVNSRYTVLVGRKDTELGELTHLSFKRNDRNPLHDWRDIQRLKNEILGPEEEACELYPAESRLVDGANQYHLWCFNGQHAPFGYTSRCVTEGKGAVAVGLAPDAKQRPFEDGDPADLIKSEGEFETKAAAYVAKQEKHAENSKKIRETLDGAYQRPCLRRSERNPECPTVLKDPAEYCGTCMARYLRELTVETAGIL